MPRNDRVNPERSFGLSVGFALMLLSGILVWRHRFTTAEIAGSAGCTLAILGKLRPRVLKWPGIFWWRFAHLIGYINSRIVLTLAFALLLVPAGIAWLVFGHDPLSRKRPRASGWTPTSARYRNKDHYEQMF
jgi:hypothetical protein